MKKQVLVLSMCVALSASTVFAATASKTVHKAPVKAPAQVVKQMSAPCKVTPVADKKAEEVLTPEQMGKKKFEERMAKERESFYKALDLSCEQKTKAEALDKKNREKAEPLMKNLRKEKAKLRELKNKKASAAKILQQKQVVKAAKKDFRKSMDSSKKEFEAILTPEQLAKFKEMDAQRQKEMKQFRKDHKKNHKKGCECPSCMKEHKGPIGHGCPVPMGPAPKK